MARFIELTTKKELYKIIENHSNVIVCFWAPWCGPCRLITPVLEDINEETNIEVIKVNTDISEKLVKIFKVTHAPTLIFFNNGKIIETLNGAQTKDNIVEVFKEDLK